MRIITLIPLAVCTLLSDFAVANTDPEPELTVPNFKNVKSWHVRVLPDSGNFKKSEHFQATAVSETLTEDWETSKMRDGDDMMTQCDHLGVCAALYCDHKGVMRLALPNPALDASVVRFWQLDARSKVKTPRTLVRADPDPVMTIQLLQPMVSVPMKTLQFEFEDSRNQGTVLDFSYSFPNAVERADADKIHTRIFWMDAVFDQWTVLSDACKAAAASGPEGE